jgi:dTDP-4-dehydrorhamnose reductase
MSHNDSGQFPSLAGLRVAVTGAGGQLGGYLCSHLRTQGAVVTGFGRAAAPGVDRVLDITDQDATQRAMRDARPEIVLHAAAYTDVDGCERSPEHAETVNVAGSEHVARAARLIGAHLVIVSTDFVFDGEDPPYLESASPNPISVYGRTKRDAEQRVLDLVPSAAVVRTAWLYGGAGKHFPRTVLNLLRARESIEVVTDEIGSPTFAGDLAQAVIALAATGDGGVFHLVNTGSVSRFDFARAVASEAGINPGRIQPISIDAFLEKYPLPARRPSNSTLVNSRAASRGISLRGWADALAEYMPCLVAEMDGTGNVPGVRQGVSAT